MMANSSDFTNSPTAERTTRRMPPEGMKASVFRDVAHTIQQTLVQHLIDNATTDDAALDPEPEPEPEAHRIRLNPNPGNELRMERVSRSLGQKMCEGWTMSAALCPKIQCGCPLMIRRNGENVENVESICVACEFENNQNENEQKKQYKEVKKEMKQQVQHEQNWSWPALRISPKHVGSKRTHSQEIQSQQQQQQQQQRQAKQTITIDATYTKPEKNTPHIINKPQSKTMSIHRMKKKSITDENERQDVAHEDMPRKDTTEEQNTHPVSVRQNGRRTFSGCFVMQSTNVSRQLSNASLDDKSFDPNTVLSHSPGLTLLAPPNTPIVLHLRGNSSDSICTHSFPQPQEKFVSGRSMSVSTSTNPVPQHHLHFSFPPLPDAPHTFPDFTHSHSSNSHLPSEYVSVIDSTLSILLGKLDTCRVHLVHNSSLHTVSSVADSISRLADALYAVRKLLPESE